MPLILDPADYAEWLDADDPKELMRPAHNERLYAYPVGSEVGKVKNNDASLIEPLDQADGDYLALIRQ
jgi:putative SOS response-associated peptidase YedK